MINNTSVLHISLGMVNSYLLKSNKCVLVDAGYPGCAEKILSFMEKHNINPTDLSLILITHGHSDHFGSIDELKDITGAKVAIHKLDAHSIRCGKNPPLHARDFKGKLFANAIKADVPGFQGFEPDILIDSELSLTEFGVDAKVIHTPGHTNGSISVAVSSGELIIGDLISGSFIRKNKPEYSSYSDDFQQMKNSMRAVMQLSPRILYVGHGGPFLPDQINNYINY